VDAVDAAYRQFDADRAMLERSLDLSSEELLRANAEQRALLGALPDAVLRVRGDGMVLDRRGGGDPSRAEPIAAGVARVQDLPLGAASERLLDALAESAADSATLGLEYRAARADDQVVFHEARVAPLPGDERLVVIRDITARKRAEVERQESLALFRSLIESLETGILIERPERTVFAVNSAFCRIFGLAVAPEALVGIDCDRAAQASRHLLAEPERFPRRIAEVLRDGERASGEVVEFADGRLFERDYLPIWSREGAFIGHLWQYRDVTARRNLELQLRQAQKMEAVGRLAGGVAHDFNNLLTTILGYGEIAAEELRDHPARGHLEEIQRAGERAAELTRQLLAFGRQQVLQTRPLDLNVVVEGLLRMLERLIGANVRIVTRLDPRVGTVRADAGQLEQVIVNLAINARDAMPGGGELRIETGEVVFDRATLRGNVLVPAGSFALLSVTDDGVGLDAETRSRVFEPFFTTKELGKGTGLGLATVYGIVKQSGGLVFVDSEPGRGASFQIYLPLVDEAVEEESPRVAPHRLDGHGTLLLVEDEPAVRELARRAMHAGGYEVLVAASGSEALRVAEAHRGKIDLLITDVVLPDLGGTTVAELLQSHRPELKVLFVSGYAEPTLLARHGLDRGAAFLQKPFTPRTLLDRVHGLVDGRGRGSIEAAAS
jgi:PAS domain S-box-containing protein